MEADPAFHFCVFFSGVTTRGGCLPNGYIGDGVGWRCTVVSGLEASETGARLWVTPDEGGDTSL